jgi:hypothetical protein
MIAVELKHDRDMDLIAAIDGYQTMTIGCFRSSLLGGCRHILGKLNAAGAVG